MTLVDTHCHLTHPRYSDDLDAVLARAREAGVGRVVCVASTREDAERIARLVGAAGEERPVHLHGTAGIHPHDAGAAVEGDLDEITRIVESNEWIVAVGETGLDYHYDHSPREVQRHLFLAHLELARSTGLPVVVHSRSAVADTIAILRDLPQGVRGVLHCFTGEEELLRAALEAGWLVSFTGLVTFPGYGGLEAVRTVPRDRYMVETDGPYLAPVPHRGRRNEPAYVRVVAEAVAALRGETLTEVARATTENAARFFGWSGDSNED